MDDDAPIRALVTRIIERSGLTVDNARDGEEAIAKIGAGDYDVLVVDLMMPKVDGFAVVEYAGKLARRPAVIVVTAGDSALIRRLDGKLVHSVVRKPFDIDVLGDLVMAAAAATQERRASPRNILDFPNQEKA